MEDLNKYRDPKKVIEEHADELSSFMEKTTRAELPKGKSKDDIWENISELLEDDEKPKRLPAWQYLGVAASLLLIATLAFLVTQQTSTKVIEVATSIGQTRMVPLPDGSLVTLNAHSSLSYSAENWNRTITLSGEAFFEVTKGSKFQVNTDIGNIEVLGTSFNVFARDADFEVACKTGKVKVSISSQSFEESITPGQIISFKTDTVRHIKRTPELMGKWQTGEFYFDNQPIDDVLAELQRQFDIQVALKADNEQLFSGYFTNTDLSDALDMVCLPLNLTYLEIKKDQYIINRRD